MSRFYCTLSTWFPHMNITPRHGYWFYVISFVGNLQNFWWTKSTNVKMCKISLDARICWKIKFIVNSKVGMDNNNNNDMIKKHNQYDTDNNNDDSDITTTTTTTTTTITTTTTTITIIIIIIIIMWLQYHYQNRKTIARKYDVSITKSNPILAGPKRWHGS